MSPTFSASKSVGLPVRMELRTYRLAELSRVSAYRWRVGRALPSAQALIARMSTAGTEVPRVLLNMWVDHPDERVTRCAVRRGLLDDVAMERLSGRAIRGADDDLAYWTPLLDLIDVNALKGRAAYAKERVLRLAGLLGDRLRAARTDPERSRVGTRALLRFRSPVIARLVAADSPSLTPAQIRQLARRHMSMEIAMSEHRTERDRAVLAEWAVLQLDAAETALNVPTLGTVEALAALDALHRRGHRLTMALAVTLLRALRRLLTDGHELPSYQMLYAMSAAAVDGAPAGDVRALTTPELGVLLNTGHANVRLATMKALGRARRAQREGRGSPGAA